MEPVAFALGLFLLALVYWDLFETVVVPRPTPGWFRIGRYLVRGSWRGLRAIRDGRPGRSYDRVLGLFAPAATVALLGAWLVTLIVGNGLIFYALRDELRPADLDLGGTLYFAATSVLTLGFGEIVAVGAPARIVVTTAAVSGLGAVALVVTFLFSLYGSYQRREVEVVALQAAAGAPPSAVALLESYAHLGLVDRLPELFLDWERWGVEVLDSHVAYPLLGYFRSSHDNLSWISALGTVLDAASLVLTTITGVPRGEAKLAKRVGTHLVEDIYNLRFRAGSQRPWIARSSTPPARDSRRPATPSNHGRRRGRGSRRPVRRTHRVSRRWPRIGPRRPPSGSATRWPSGRRFTSRRSVSPPSVDPARSVERTYLVLTLLTTLASSFIWGINTIFLLDAGLSNAEAFAANAFFTVGQVIFEVPTGRRRRHPRPAVLVRARRRARCSCRPCSTW